MRNVNTSSHAIREAIDICVRTLKALRSISLKLRGKYVVAGNDWNDAKYQQLGDIINECTSSFDKFARDLDGCPTLLSDMARFIREYEEMNLLSGASYSNGDYSGGVSNIPVRDEELSSVWWCMMEKINIDRFTDVAYVQSWHGKFDVRKIKRGHHRFYISSAVNITLS